MKTMSLNEFLSKGKNNECVQKKNLYKFQAVVPITTVPTILDNSVNILQSVCEFTCVISCIGQVIKILKEDGEEEEKTYKIVKTVVKHGVLLCIVLASPYFGNLIISMGGLKYVK